MSSWDERYDTEEYRYGNRPVVFLEHALIGVPPGRALCIGAGEGRNAVWLARKGWSVTALDLSRVGLEKASRLANDNHVELKTVIADASTWNMGEGRWDLITAFFVHGPPDVRDSIHRRAAAALAPGGRFVLEGFTPRQMGRNTGGPGTSRNGEKPPPNLADLFIEPEELRNQLPGLELEVLTEEIIELSGGTHHNGGKGAVVHCIGLRT